MKKIGRVFISILMGTFLTTGCVNSKSSQLNSEKKMTEEAPSEFHDDDLSQIAETSCLFDYDNGASYLGNDSFILEGAFKKRYDEGKLRAVLAASPKGIVEFAKSQGVQFFKSGRHKTTSCLVMAPLEEAPYDLKSYLDDIDADGRVLGVYLTGQTPELPSTQDEAAIVVREDATKWTLLHEFMHHLFQSQHRSDFHGVDVSQNLETVGRALEESRSHFLSTFAEEEIPEAAQSYVDAQTGYVTSVLEYVKAYSLEEIAIEERLTKAYDDQTLTDVLPGQKITSASYVATAARRTLEILKDLEDVDVQVKMDLQDLKTNTASLLAAVKTVAGHKELAERHLKNAQGYLLQQAFASKQMGISDTAAQLKARALPRVRCTHSKTADQAYSAVRRRVLNR